MTTITHHAAITSINEELVKDDTITSVDTITVSEIGTGEAVDTVEVESTSDTAPYDAALREAGYTIHHTEGSGGDITWHLVTPGPVGRPTRVALHEDNAGGVTWTITDDDGREESWHTGDAPVPTGHGDAAHADAEGIRDGTWHPATDDGWTLTSTPDQDADHDAAVLIGVLDASGWHTGDRDRIGTAGVIYLSGGRSRD